MNLKSKILTVNETAEILRTTPDTVRRLINNGELKAGRVGRIYKIPMDEIQTYFNLSVAIPKSKAKKEQRQINHIRTPFEVTRQYLTKTPA